MDFTAMETALGTQTLFLVFDDLDVIGIDLGHDHGNVGRKAVSGVVGYNRALFLGDSLFQSTCGVFIHIDCTESEVDFVDEFVQLGIDIEDHQILCFRGNGGVHLPALADASS